MNKVFFYLSFITICLAKGCASAQQPAPDEKSNSTNEKIKPRDKMFTCPEPKMGAFIL